MTDEAVAAACHRAEAALARDPATGRPVRDDAERLAALGALDCARADVANDSRALRRVEAYRAELLRALDRRTEAATAYAAALLADLENAEAAHDGITDLLNELGGLEDAERVALAARARHPGRAWQWDALVSESRRRRRLEEEAPVPPADLGRLRAEVARRLRDTPCRHDDDARPVAAAAATALGLDPKAVLPWLSELGACCCDCQVARVAGPREPRAPR